jgi:hypothetical protein
LFQTTYIYICIVYSMYIYIHYPYDTINSNNNIVCEISETKFDDDWAKNKLLWMNQAG